MTKQKKPTRATLKIEKERCDIVRKFFQHVQGIERKIDFLYDRITRAQTLQEKNGVEDGVRVRRSIKGDPIGEGFVKLEEYIDKLNTELIVLTENELAVIKCLDSIADSPGYDVVRLHYIDGERYRDVAKNLGYTEDHVKRLCRDSLIALYDFIPIEYRQK